MTELAILFLHHNDYLETRVHAAQFKKLNPNAAFIPLTMENGLQNAIRPKSIELQSLKTTTDKAEQCDQMVWAWWRSSERVEAERYVVVESDTLALEPFRWFHSRVWDAPASCGYVNDRADYPGNHWFTTIDKLVEHRHPLVTWPISCMMFSRDTMEKLSNEVLHPFYSGLMCELRIGTALRSIGVTPQQIRPDIRNYVWWKPRHPSKWMCWGIWHTCKEWLPIHDRLKQENNIV